MLQRVLVLAARAGLHGRQAVAAPAAILLSRHLQHTCSARATFSNKSPVRIQGWQRTPERRLQTDAGPRKQAVEAVAKEQVQVKEFEEIPGPKPWPVLENTAYLLMHKDFNPEQHEKMWESLFEEYGPLFKLKLVAMPVMVASANPDDIETFYKATRDDPIREAFTALKKIRQDAPDNYFNKKSGLLPENGEEWWRLRSRVQAPLLRPRNVAMYLPKVDKATLAFMDRIEPMQEQLGRVPDNFLLELYKWALECVGVVALDRELGCLEPGLSEDSVPMKMIRHINDMMIAMNQLEMGPPFWRLFRTKQYVKLETAHGAFLEIADKSIREATLSLEEAAARGGDPDRTLTVMETLLNTEGLSRSDVATMILDMLFAGVDTTSHTIAFTLYLLARNPESQRKLQEEVDRVLGDSSALQPEHIAAMPYMVNVVKETLRLYPLAIGNARVLTRDIVMSGYKVPAGALAMGFNSFISRNEKYFQRAEEFIPERWDRNRPLGPIHPYASLPFSHGTRMCIGKRIAEQEIYTFLIRAMQKYWVTFESSEEMRVKTALVLKPAIGLPFKFHPRS